MDNNIKFIFQNNRKAIAIIEKSIYYFRIQNHDAALRNINNVIALFNVYVEKLLLYSEYFNEIYTLVNVETLTEMLQELFDAQKNQDYILLADLYELKFIPFLINLQETIMNKENQFPVDFFSENLDALERVDNSLAALIRAADPAASNYIIENTSSGLKTAAVIMDGKKFYMHSNRNAVNEAFQLALSWYEEDKKTYLVYGFGLGYHIEELFEIDKNIYIEVYDCDINMIRLSCTCRDLKPIIDNPNITIIYDPEFKGLTKRISQIDEETVLVLHYPSMKNIQNNNIKRKLEDYFIQYSSIKNQRYLLNSNFNSNIKKYDYIVDELREAFTDKSLFIVAAGPSLDSNFRKLKAVGDKGIILATGTVLRKLLEEGIRPDYVLVTDPNQRTYKQILGLEECDIPMIFLSTAYIGFASNYKGKKYVMLQKGYPKAEKFAENIQAHCFQTGGSVSTAALDIGITLGCRRIIFLGLDLAYTNNLAHASETSRRNVVETEDMRQVVDIHGNTITTSRSLDMFRIWIENRIRDVKGIEFIDATEGGAMIHGMRIAKLEEVLKEI